MSIARQIALGTLAAGIAACGYPDFSYGTGDSSGSSGSSGTFIPSETSGSSGSSGSGRDPSTCKVTHPGGGTCEYTPGAECGCSGGEKCAVVNEATGHSECTRAGSTKKYEKCSSDNDCVAGTFCEQFTGVCAPICQNIDDCGKDGEKGSQCIPVGSAAGTAIPGLKICTAHCDPVSAKPCGSNVNCVYVADITEFDCLSSLRFKEGAQCQSPASCDKGLTCVGTTDAGTCQPWCKPVNTTAGNGCPTAKPRCTPLSNVAIEYNDVEYGACVAK